jgi:CRP-like cAMP-binding protein
MKMLRNKITILYNNPLFEHFSAFERLEFIKLCHRRTYKQGEVIYHQEDPATGIYFIEEGKVTLSVKQTNEESTDSRIELTKPASFGLMIPNYTSRREATAVCDSDCVIYGFFQPDYETLKKRHPKIAANFLEALSRTLGSLTDHLTRSLEEQIGKLESKKIILNALRELH